jgi:hypothetical protein
MIIVRVELWSARDGSVTELARMHVCNAGGGGRLRDYVVRTLRGRSKSALDANVAQREGRVIDHPSEELHVWNLVAKALAAMGYGKP